MKLRPVTLHGTRGHTPRDKSHLLASARGADLPEVLHSPLRLLIVLFLRPLAMAAPVASLLYLLWPR